MHRFSAARRLTLLTLGYAVLPIIPAFADRVSDQVHPSVTTLPALKYAIAQPRVPSANPPVLFLMHGYGADEQDLLPLAASLPAELLVISLRAPFSNVGGGYRWYDNESLDGQTNGNKTQLRESRAAVTRMIQQLTKHFGVNPEHVFLGGFSQGAIMTYYMGLSTPNQFRGCLVLSGAILPAVEQLLVPPVDDSHIPFFVGHGTGDHVIPFADADQSAMLLYTRRVPVDFKSYKGMDHSISDQEITDVNAWFQKVGV